MTQDKQNPLSFDETKTLIEAKLDGESLSIEEENALSQSLPLHPPLKAYYESATQVLGGLKDLKQTSPLGSNFTDQVMNQVENQSNALSPKSVKKPFWKNPVVQLTTIAAAISLILLVPGMNPFVNSTGESNPVVAENPNPVQTNSKSSNQSVTDLNPVVAPALAEEVVTEEEVFVAQVLGTTNEIVPEGDIWGNTDDPMVMLVGF